jgi:hypothetical protein
MAVIDVYINSDGEAFCSPWRAGANPNSTVVWKARHGGNKQNIHFAVHFGTDSPFAVFGGTGHGNQDVSLPVKYDHATGGAKVFKYTVAIWDGQKVHITDPEIIIPPLPPAP